MCQNMRRPGWAEGREAAGPRWAGLPGQGGAALRVRWRDARRADLRHCLARGAHCEFMQLITLALVMMSLPSV